MSKRVNLILEGGGMRGLYTAGVLDFFHDKKINFLDIVGVSAGACNAVSYISRQRGRNLAINAGYCRDKRYMSLAGLFTRGSIFNMDFLFGDIPNELVPFDYEAYTNAPNKLTAVVTDCETGEPVYYPIKDMRNDDVYVRASSSIPLVSPIVEADGRKLVDGGTADSIPINYSVKQGFDKHVVVLTQHNGYQKKPSKYMNLIQRRIKQYPKLIEALKNRHISYNESLKLVHDLEKAGKAFVICPKEPLNISRFEKNTEKLKSVYNLGYNDAAARYNELLEFISVCDNVEK